MRLNGWQRVGIVASVVWILGAGFAQRNADVKYAQSFVDTQYRLCVDREMQTKEFDLSGCSGEMQKDFDFMIDGSWSKVLLVSFLPIPLGWLAVYLILRVTRWVRAGFKQA